MDIASANSNIPESKSNVPRKTLPIHQAAQLVLALLGAIGVQSSNAQTAGAALGSLKLKNTELELRTFGEKLPGNTTLANDLALLKEGLTPDEERKIRETMNKVLSHPQYGPLARKVLDALDEKGHSITETAEEKKARLDQERLEKELAKKQDEITKNKPKLIIDFNKSILAGGWSVITNKQDAALDGEAKIYYKGGVVTVELKKGKKSRVEREVPVSPGSYSIDIKVTGGTLVVWIQRPDGTDERKQLGTGDHNIGDIKSMRLGGAVDNNLSPMLVVNKFELRDNDIQAPKVVKN